MNAPPPPPEPGSVGIDISVVIPCFNEEGNARGIAEAVIRELVRYTPSFEVIFIDNASTDRTVEVIRALCALEPRVKLIVNTRNFGQMRSPTHAIYQARGRGVIAMCADFQDPPELIGPFIERWRAGADIVLGVRKAEPTVFWLRFLRHAAYSFLDRFGDFPIVPSATGFGIYDQKVVACLSRWNEPEPFFRGMLAETGFSIATIPYARAARAAGFSKNNLWRLADFCLSGIAGSAKKLLRLPFLIAAVTGAVALMTLLYAMLLAATGEGGGAMAWRAFEELQFTLLFLVLGLMGDQIRLISERTRQVPLVLEKERINFDGH
jgi:glycosyltransferase involved in cell wall biosynthesis